MPCPSSPLLVFSDGRKKRRALTSPSFLLVFLQLGSAPGAGFGARIRPVSSPSFAVTLGTLLAQIPSSQPFRAVRGQVPVPCGTRSLAPKASTQRERGGSCSGAGASQGSGCRVRGTVLPRSIPSPSLATGALHKPGSGIQPRREDPAREAGSSPELPAALVMRAAGRG